MSQAGVKSDKELRSFGMVMSSAFAVLSGLLLFYDKPAAPYLLGLAILFFLAGFAVPRVLAPIEKIWMAFAERLGVVMTFVVLALAFYVIMTPMALLTRVLGKDLLALRLKPKGESYWEPVEEDGPAGRFFKPY